MAEIIERSHREEEVWFQRYFEDAKYHDGGVVFPCTETGEQKINEMNNLLLERYSYCLSHKNEYIDRGVVKRVSSYRVPNILRCDCGEEFSLDCEWMGAEECPKCGRWYNAGGQELNPPHMWEEPLEEE